MSRGLMKLLLSWSILPVGIRSTYQGWSREETCWNPGKGGAYQSWCNVGNGGRDCLVRDGGGRKRRRGNPRLLSWFILTFVYCTFFCKCRSTLIWMKRIFFKTCVKLFYFLCFALYWSRRMIIRHGVFMLFCMWSARVIGSWIDGYSYV